MKRIGIGLLWGIGGYILVAVVCYFLVIQLSSNTHDRDLEAGMTSVFFFGPIGGVLGFIVGVLKRRRPELATTVDP